MPIKSQSFPTVPGTHILKVPLLYAITPLAVQREGLEQTQVTTFFPTFPEFFYGSGVIRFDTAYPFIKNEKVYVLWLQP